MMRILLGLSALAVLALDTAAQAQPAPPGSYRERCTDIRMNGQFLSATCRGLRGGGQSSINVQSCASDISVDETGALSCQGPGVAPRPGYNPRPDPGYGGPPAVVRPPPPGYGRDTITVYSRRNWDGRSERFDGPVPDLDDIGLNDHIRSIRLGQRSGPWLVCSDADFRGHCERIDGDLADTRRIGMDRTISSLRPLRPEPR